MKEMLLALLLLIIGFVLLIKGADFFVDGSSSVAKRLKVPSMIIGLTIVAMGTSLPECAVSVTASLNNNNALAVSNVIGSNIFNILLVLGVAGAISPVIFISENIIDIIILIIMSVVVWVFAWSKKKLVRWHGAAMLVSYAIYLVYICMR